MVVATGTHLRAPPRQRPVEPPRSDVVREESTGRAIARELTKKEKCSRILWEDALKMWNREIRKKSGGREPCTENVHTLGCRVLASRLQALMSSGSEGMGDRDMRSLELTQKQVITE